jgi:hypothetical protein
MPELTSLDDLSGRDLNESQLQGLVAQIDLDIANLLQDGKLAAGRYTLDGAGGISVDRAANLQALLAARAFYTQQLQALPTWQTSSVESDAGLDLLP